MTSVFLRPLNTSNNLLRPGSNVTSYHVLPDVEIYTYTHIYIHTHIVVYQIYII